MNSSYEQNNCGEIFKNLILKYKPLKAVELGVLHGYSTFYIATALKLNKMLLNIDGHLDSYDLWEDYPYKHGNMEHVQRMLKSDKLNSFVTLHKGDAFDVHVNYKQEINFLHVDISNTGETVRKIMELWNDKIVCGGIIIFEGGSEERDKVEWMIKYDKAPIRPEIFNNKIINVCYTYAIYPQFPSLTVLHKEKVR